MNRRQFLCIVFLLISALPTFAQIRELHPLLPYIFFDSASAVIPDRYTLYASLEETKAFSEANLPSSTLDIYHHLLNIIGSRMQRYPDAHIEIVGCNSMQPEIGEVIEVSKRRGEVVRGYLSEIWGIDTSRLGLLAPRGFPPKDPLGVVENPRVEIVTNDWRIIHPIITYDTTNYLELVDSVSNHYYLILFESNDLEMGPIHKRIMEEYVMTKLCKPARVTVNGFNDLGFDSSFVHNFFIGARVNNVTKYIKSEAQTGVIYRLSTQIVSKTAPLYANDLPEGRFYNRCVEIVVVSPAQ